MRLCCVVVTVFFGKDATLQVTAGTSAAQAQNPNQWLTLDPNEDDPAPIVSEILAKLKSALDKPGGDGMEMDVRGRFLLKELVALNTASKEELDKLPGVGPALAKKIVAARPFKTLDDLRRVDGIGAEKLAALKPLLKLT
jgi:competence ComEA-like helix-hairpin-helix protein